MNPEVLKASTSSQLEIYAYPVNMLNFRTPFSEAQVRFTVEEGKNLVELLDESPDGKVIVRSKGTEGEAIIGIYSLKSGVQISRVLVKIMPRDLA